MYWRTKTFAMLSPCLKTKTVAKMSPCLKTKTFAMMCSCLKTKTFAMMCSCLKTKTLLWVSSLLGCASESFKRCALEKRERKKKNALVTKCAYAETDI